MDKNTVLKVSDLLGLKVTGNEQDWAIEFADKNRIQEFINLLQKSKFEMDIRVAIMSLILASYDDYLMSSNVKNELWEEIIQILDANKEEYIGILNYWALWNEEETCDLFIITPLIRNYLNGN